MSKENYNLEKSIFSGINILELNLESLVNSRIDNIDKNKLLKKLEDVKANINYFSTKIEEALVSENKQKEKFWFNEKTANFLGLQLYIDTNSNNFTSVFGK